MQKCSSIEGKIERGHKIPKEFPFILSNDVESINKTKDVIKMLYALGFKEDLDRTAEKTIRAGKGKNRARPYRIKKSILFVVTKKCALNKSALNISGVDIVDPSHLNADILAPGTQPGRLTLYTEGAIDKIAEMFKY